MYEHLYLPKRRQARPARPPADDTPVPSRLSMLIRHDERVRLTKKGARLLQDHLARTQRQGRR